MEGQVGQAGGEGTLGGDVAQRHHREGAPGVVASDRRGGLGRDHVAVAAHEARDRALSGQVAAGQPHCSLVRRVLVVHVAQSGEVAADEVGRLVAQQGAQGGVGSLDTSVGTYHRHRRHVVLEGGAKAALLAGARLVRGAVDEGDARDLEAVAQHEGGDDHHDQVTPPAPELEGRVREPDLRGCQEHEPEQGWAERAHQPEGQPAVEDGNQESQDDDEAGHAPHAVVLARVDEGVARDDHDDEGLRPPESWLVPRGMREIAHQLAPRAALLGADRVGHDVISAHARPCGGARACRTIGSS